MAQKKAATQDFSKYIRRVWMMFLGGILLIVLMFLLASWGAFGEMPDHTVLENPKTNLATEIISSDGKTLGKFYLNDNRTPVVVKSYWHLRHFQVLRLPLKFL
mgnify:CR=1 FL=1